MDNIFGFLSEKEYKAQMERQNELLAAIASGTAGADFTDEMFVNLLDGSNTRPFSGLGGP